MLKIGKGRIIREGGRICLLSYGTRLEQARLAADQLDAQGFRTSVVDARFMKPLDEELILRLAREHEILLTLEEGAIGGFGSHVMHMLAENGQLEGGLKCRSLVLPDSLLTKTSPMPCMMQRGLMPRKLSKPCALWGLMARRLKTSRQRPVPERG